MKRPTPWSRRNFPALVLFVIVFGGLYYVATREYLPKKAVLFEHTAPTAVTEEKPLELEWPSRKGELPAPPFSLLIPHTAFVEGLWRDRVTVQRLSTGHDMLYLFTALPDPDGLSVKALGDWCPSGLESEDCNVAELRLALMQDAPDRSDPGHMVMDSRARGFSDAASSGPIRRLNAFWVKEVRETGRLEFVGWDCEGEAPTGTISTDPAKPITERNRCFEPATIEERRAPKRHGYQRFVQLTACSGGGRACKLYFPFRGRHVEAVPTESPITAPTEQATGHLFLAAWEFLNRLRQDSRSPPSADRLLGRATRSLENCRSIDALLPPSAPQNANKRNQLGRYARWQCAYAAQAAAGALRGKPAEANGVLQAALSAVHFPSGALEASLRKTAIDALSRAGLAETPAMAEAQLALAVRMPDGTPRSREREAKRAALKEALRVAETALPPGSDLQVAIYRAVERTYDAELETDEKLTVLERWQAAVRQARGPTDAGLRDPSHSRCGVLESANRPHDLARCADEYLPLWLGAVALETGPVLPNDWARTGLDLLRWYGRYALTQDKPAEVLPTMRKIAGILQPRMSGYVWATQGAPSLKYVEDRARFRVPR